MKKSIILFVGLLITVATLHAQSTYFYISGKVIDAVTQQPLQAASVFAQNTTSGTVTDAAGNFKIPLNNGGYDLVVSFTGYESASRRITTADGNDPNIVIALKQAEKSMEVVAVRSTNEVKNGWEQYGDFFTEQFLGKTPNSALCSFANKEVLKFYFSKKRNRLKVASTEPLIIENKALGYRIKYLLDSLTYDYTNLVTQYVGSPLFEEMTATDSMQAVLWQQNRQKAYQGSVLHLMRSIYRKEMKSAGFEIQFLVKDRLAGDTAIKLKDFYGALNYDKNDTTQVVDIFPNQQEVAVLYLNEKPDAGFSFSDNDQPRKYQFSVLSFAAGEPISIEQNGFHYNQTDITIQGYMAWEKVADMVPYDFIPSVQ